MKKRMSKRFFLAAACLQLLFGANAYAQQGMGIIKGTVSDKTTNAPIAGVAVKATSPALQGEQSVTTDEKGRYRIANLPPGIYAVEVEGESYERYTQQAIQLRADVEFRLNIGLTSATAGAGGPSTKGVEEMVVTGGAPTVDIGSTQMSTNITSDFTKRIPVGMPTGRGGANRSIESVAAVAPQAQADTYGTSMSGATSPENRYVVDGMSIGDPAFATMGTPLSSEFVSEINVITSGYMPEYGKATGGILNAVTKSGSNKFAGSIWGTYTPGFLEGPRKTVKNDAQTIVVKRTLNHIFDVGADIGGPIVLDKLWFYFGAGYSQSSYNQNRSLYRLTWRDTKKPDEETDDPDDTIWETEKESDKEDAFAKSEKIAGTGQNFTETDKTLQLMGKLTYTINANHRLNLTAIGSPNWFSNYTDVMTGYEQTQFVKTKSFTFDSGLDWIASNNDMSFTLNTKIGWHHQKSNDFALDGTELGDDSGQASVSLVSWRRNNPYMRSITAFENFDNEKDCAKQDGAPDYAVRCPVQIYNTGGAGRLDRFTLDRLTAQSVATVLGDLLGRHTIKIGAEYELNMFDNEKGYTGKRAVRESTRGTYLLDYRDYGYLTAPDEAVFMEILHNKTKSHSLGAFAQDSWEILADTLTLNFGFRYDAQMIYGHGNELALTLPNQWSPRAGIIFDPTQEGAAKIFGNFAIFFENVPLDLADRAGTGEMGINGYYTPYAPGGPSIDEFEDDNETYCDPHETDPDNDNACFNADDKDQLVNNKQAVANGQEYETPNVHYNHMNGKVPIDPDLKPQSQTELMFGAEYAVFDLVRVSAIYTRRWMNNIIEDMSRDEAQTYFIGNPGSGIASDFPKAKRNYDAITLAATKTFSDHWLAQVSYTLSWLRGNYGGLFRAETGQLDPNINSDYDLRSLVVNRDGPLGGDNRHQIKVYGAYDFPITDNMEIAAGLGFSTRSGGPTNYLGAHSLYGTDEVFILPRGAGKRLPWRSALDLHLGYKIKFDERFSLSVEGDVFNVLNFQAVTRYDETYTLASVRPIEGGTKDDLDGLILDETGEPITKEDLNTNFGRASQYQNPLTVRFGVRATF